MAGKNLSTFIAVSPQISNLEGIDVAALEAENRQAQQRGEQFAAQWTTLLNEVRWTKTKVVLAYLWDEFSNDELDALLSLLKRLVTRIRESKP